ncbi:hypothetical protein KAU43_06250 [candidate division WOR-3 bacterium]|nr:hypothetical protein [candidate division WOR-3 bacterium]
MEYIKDEDGITYCEFENLKEANKEMYNALVLLKEAGDRLLALTGTISSGILIDRINDFISDMGYPEHIRKLIINEGTGMKSLSYFSHNFKHFYDDGTKMAWEDAFRKAIDKTIDQLTSEEVHCPNCDCVAVGDDKQENYYCFNCQKQFKKGDD